MVACEHPAHYYFFGVHDFHVPQLLRISIRIRHGRRLRAVFVNSDPGGEIWYEVWPDADIWCGFAEWLDSHIERDATS